MLQEHPFGFIFMDIQNCNAFLWFLRDFDSDVHLALQQ